MMEKNTNYVSPEVKVIAVKSGHVLCSSDYANGPRKDFGFDWDDDLY